MSFALLAACGPLFSFMAMVAVYCMPRQPVIRPDGSAYQPITAHIYCRRFAIRGVLVGLPLGLMAALLTWVIG